MMNPKALEALRQARALFEQNKADDIPDSITNAPDPIRKPQVHLIPTHAPKFDQQSMKEEHKQMEQTQKQTDKYVDMSVMQAVKACLAKGIKKPADIAKETGKKSNQIYTQLWKLKEQKRKARLAAKTAVKIQSVKQQLKDEWDREPTPFEDAHYVVLKSREDYETEIAKLVEENLELKAVIKYLERKASNV